MKVAIKIPDSHRRQLEILSLNRGLSYDEIIRDLIGLFVFMVPFKNNNEFKGWFKLNLQKFGFRKIVGKQDFQNSYYTLEDMNGKLKKVGVELFPEDFLRRNHHLKADLLICFFSDKDKLGEIPVVSFIQPPKLDGTSRHNKQEFASISVPASLYRRMEMAAGNAGFASVSDYASYLLRESISRHERETRPECLTHDLEQVKKRLKALGYID